MIRGVEALSHRKKKKKNTIFSSIIKIILITFFMYITITHFFISPVRLTSVSMTPGIEQGDRVLISPLVYGPELPFIKYRLSGIDTPGRGDIIALRPPVYSNDNFFSIIFESVIRFFTLQKKSLIHDADNERISEYSIKRIIGLPGDTIKMEGFIAYIKPQGAVDFIKESSLIKEKYTFNINGKYTPDNWDDSYPFSGFINEITLQPDEYFVLGDNRTQSNDSYAWGPVHFSRISGKVIFTYWPFHKFGIP